MATNRVIASVPLDILQHIFAQVDRRVDVLSCVQVSRSWKEAALPVLYSITEFTHVPPLRIFIDTIEASTVDGRCLAHHMRSFTAHLSIVKSAWRIYTLVMAGLVAILPYAKSLRIVSTSGITALHIIPVLSRTCFNTLQDLSVRLMSREVQSVLLYLYAFQALRVLNLDIYVPHVLDPPPATAIPAWSFFCLEVLTLSLEGCHFHTVRIFRLLNTCQLPALRRLQIRATLETITLDAAKSFADLCIKLPRLAELDTDIDAEWYPHILPSVRAPSLCIKDPDMTLIAQLSSTIRRLHFISSSFAPTFYTCLWTVFDHLLAYRPDIQDVHMPPHFSWPRDPDPARQQQVYLPAQNEDANLPQLLRYAFLFARRGIHLRDGQGHTMADYLQSI